MFVRAGCRIHSNFIRRKLGLFRIHCTWKKDILYGTFIPLSTLTGLLRLSVASCGEDVLSMLLIASDFRELTNPEGLPEVGRLYCNN